MRRNKRGEFRSDLLIRNIPALRLKGTLTFRITLMPLTGGPKIIAVSEDLKKYFNKWSIIYETAIKGDSYYFPERLNGEFLLEARKKMGSMLFANQYLNEVFPAEDAKFKKEWIKYWSSVPERHTNFAFIDPAISTEDGADYTGIVVVSVTPETQWYIRVARRQRMNPTEIIHMIFDLYRTYKCAIIGIEDVAYQKALLYMMDEEMRRRKVFLPVRGINKGNKTSKEQHIMSLIPLFEWQRILLGPGMDDFEKELLQFPRSSHDDIIDACASLQQIIYYPQAEKENLDGITNPNDPRYESALIRRLAGRANEALGD